MASVSSDFDCVIVFCGVFKLSCTQYVFDIAYWSMRVNWMLWVDDIYIAL